MTQRQRSGVLAIIAAHKAKLIVDKRELTELGKLAKEMKVNDFVSYLSFHNDQAFLVLNNPIEDWAIAPKAVDGDKHDDEPK